MKFTVSSFSLDINDYIYIFMYTSKNYLILSLFGAGLVAYISEFKILYIIIFLIFIAMCIGIRYLLSVVKLKKLILSYYVKISEKNLFIYNSEESNFTLDFKDIKYILLEKTGFKFFIVTKSNCYTTISNMLENYDKLLSKLKEKNLPFREDILDDYENILVDYIEL